MSVIIVGFACIAAVLFGGFWFGARRERGEILRFMKALWTPPRTVSHEIPLFNPASLSGLPSPAIRYLQYSIAAGQPLTRAVRFTMKGDIRLSRSRPPAPFRAEEVLHADKGFLWKAQVGNPLPIRGFDRYFQGIGEMRWRLFGLIPLIRARDANITRSARERFVMERVLAPGSLLPGENVEWREIDERTALLRIRQDRHWHELRLEVEASGAPHKLSMERWGNFETANKAWQTIPYAARFDGETPVKGYTLPGAIRVCWWAGTDRELDVVRFEITSVDFVANAP